MRTLSLVMFIGISSLLSRATCGATEVGDPSCAPILSEATAEVELRILERQSRVMSSEAGSILSLVTLDGQEDAFTNLSPKDQFRWLRRQIARRETSFTVDRRIPNLRLRRTVRLRWDRPTVFLNVEYAPGLDHDVDLTPLRGSSQVELGSASAGVTGEMIEVHFRSATLRPGQLEREVWTLLDGLGISKTAAHVHVVVPVARERLGEEAERFGLVNGYRYLNMAAEMISILYRGNSIQSKRLAAWGALYGIKLAELLSDLEAYAEDGSMPEKDRHKMSYVGFHFPNKYDGRDNFGLHFRSVDRRVSDQMRSLLDDGRAFLRRPTWTEPNHVAWRAAHQGKSPLGFATVVLWHRESFERPDSEGAPRAIRHRLMNDEGLRDEIEETGVTLYEAQMLTYDWARDPLFFGDARAIETLGRCQRQAFARFAAARRYRLEFTRDFLRCAKIYERVRERLRQAPT